MKDQLLIPTKLRVGYQERPDTYTGKLAYVIYYDTKGKLRKEPSWKGWIKHDLGDFDNVPTEGFVLNKDVGGTRHSYGWNARIEKVRVFDPRGFEFEISIPNLLFVLQECTSSKGKGLEGTFVLAWNGAEGPILLPTSCREYQESQKFSAGLAGKVSSKELVPGCTYLTKKQLELVYLGKFNYSNDRGEESYDKSFSVHNGHVFINPKGSGHRKYSFQKDIISRFEFLKASDLSARLSDTPVENYAEYMDEFNQSKYTAVYKDITRKSFKIDHKDSIYNAEQELGQGFQKVDGTDESWESVRVRVISNQGSSRDSYYRRYYDPIGYKISRSKIATFADGEIVIKDSPNAKKDDKLYSKAEIEALDLRSLVVAFKKGKSLELKV